VVLTASPTRRFAPRGDPASQSSDACPTRKCSDALSINFARQVLVMATSHVEAYEGDSRRHVLLEVPYSDN
jgi:hypothetical protein